MTVMKNLFSNLFVKTSAVIFLLLTAALLLFPNEIAQSVRTSANYCLSVLLPSLFPFMVLTAFAVNSSAGEVLGDLLGFISKYVFRLPKICTPTILLSFIGGYPAGAAGISLLLKNGSITQKEASRMLLFCVNPGIAFVVTFLGSTILRSTRTGILLFFAVTISGVLIGCISGLFHPVPQSRAQAPKKEHSSAVIRSTSQACSSMLKMCSCVILFAGLNTVLHASGIFQFTAAFLARFGFLTPPEAASALSFLIEVTSAVNDAVTLKAPLMLYAFGLAFGGLCVHLQVFSFFEVFPLSRTKYLVLRLIHGLSAALIYQLLSAAFPSAAPVLAPAQPPVASVITMPIAGGLSLLMMSVIFLLAAFKSPFAEKKVL